MGAKLFIRIPKHPHKKGCSCQPMKFILKLSTHVFVIIIKSQEKIKPVKWSFLNFNLNGQNFAESKNQDFM